MGIKERARAIMKEQGVPILPGSTGALSSAEEGVETASKIGYPVIIKAAAGGGGRGMRVVNKAEDLPALLTQAQQEAGAAFSSADVYLEKYIGRRGTSSFSFWPTSTGMSKFWANATVASSGGIRSCWRNHPHRRFVPKCAIGSWPNCGKPFAPLGTATPALSNF